ncbi:MAG TPA: GDSL-type esterase/lipase family protein [Kiritimatiellia bacterium]|nr:GDSL-type esterase/lipase family protein [Kiritimatiellia bacterium]
MNVRRNIRRMVFALAVPTLAAFLLSGCEGDGDDEDLSVPAGTMGTNETADADAAAPEDPDFPDGLHPTASASRTIAEVFARQISPAADAGGDPAPVVACIGDSITARGYPPYLADLTGLPVVNAGKGGEGSGGTAARAPGVLAEYRPAYLCILTGINDVSGGDAPIETIVANIESIVNAAKANNAIPVVGTLTPLSGSHREWADDGRACSQAIRAMAARTGVRLADVAAAFD